MFQFTRLTAKRAVAKASPLQPKCLFAFPAPLVHAQARWYCQEPNKKDSFWTRVQKEVREASALEEPIVPIGAKKPKQRTSRGILDAIELASGSVLTAITSVGKVFTWMSAIATVSLSLLADNALSRRISEEYNQIRFGVKLKMNPDAIRAPYKPGEVNEEVTALAMRKKTFSEQTKETLTDLVPPEVRSKFKAEEWQQFVLAMKDTYEEVAGENDIGKTVKAIQQWDPNFTMETLTDRLESDIEIMVQVYYSPHSHNKIKNIASEQFIAVMKAQAEKMKDQYYYESQVYLVEDDYEIITAIVDENNAPSIRFLVWVNFVFQKISVQTGDSLEPEHHMRIPFIIMYTYNDKQQWIVFAIHPIQGDALA